MNDTGVLTMSYIYHSGTPHQGNTPHSGRYPWGSGENAYQRERDFMDRVNALKREGLSEKERAERLGLTVNQLRNEVSLASGRIREANVVRARELYSKGMGATEITVALGLPKSKESTVRNWLKDSVNRKHEIAKATADLLRENVDEMRYIDVGKGVAEGMGISSTRLKAAVTALQEEGYIYTDVYIPNPNNPSQYTPMKVLTRPDVTPEELRANKDNIGIINAHYADPHDTNPSGLDPIKSISSKRIQIVYAEDGGGQKDGVIELRRGVKGLDLGASMYAQVRIGVDGTHYLKGMAIYSDDLPDGVDIRFNSSKTKDRPYDDVVKPMKSDPETTNPFGASITRQNGYLNIVNEEGDWARWSKTLASQMLSKQPVALAKRQLNLAYAEKRQEYEEIMSLTNPTVKKYLLEQFSDSCDTAARNLKAAAMPGQASHVILPVNSLKENEVYAPNYNNGDRVVLIRYPHGGLFEIPELRVNNNNPEAKKIFENTKTGLKAPDAIGINYKVASRLSGADFDGDTVLVIPNRNGAIKTAKPLQELKNFDPHEQYRGYEGMPVISKKHMQREMGEVSNLISDMTIKGAPYSEIAKAVRYSMVVIDAKKHKLNYRQAREDNDIEGLQRKWQKKEEPTPSGKDYGGASTLISRAKSEERVPERKQGRSGYYINPDTGEKVYRETGRYYEKMKKNKTTGEWESTGKIIFRQSKSTKMDEAKDARKLSSGTEIEEVYANYANHMKSLANQARKDYISTKDTAYSPSARAEYKKEAEDIIRRVNETKSKLPLERKAKAIAAKTAKERIEDETGLPYRAAVKIMDSEDVKKIRSQALTGARAKVGSKKPKFEVSDREWEAIQKGAVSATTFKEALRYMDQDELKARAMPKQKVGLTESKKALIKAKLAAGYTQKEVADAMGVSVSSVRNAMMN